MKAFVVAALENFCHCVEIFGESSTYVRFQMDKGDHNDGLNSQTLFGHIVYRTEAEEEEEEEEERVSPPIMLKMMPLVPQIKDTPQVQFFNEIFFYTKALPVFQQSGTNLEKLLPKFYDSQIFLNAQADDFIIILENLRPQGFRIAEHHSFLDLEHLTLMLRKLGNFHAHSYYAKKNNPLEFYALDKWFRSMFDAVIERFPNRITTWASRGLQPLRQDPRYKNRLEKVAKIIANADEFLHSIDNLQRKEPLSVLCHGDYIRGNVMFRYEKGEPCDLRMIDMAWCRIASPVVDLSTVLYLNADQMTRNLHWDHLIDSYYDGLCEIFGANAVPHRNSIVQEFHNNALYGYLVASYFLPRLVALDRGMKTFEQLLGDEYVGCSYESVPAEMLDHVMDTIGEAEGTEAMANVLRDIIDRNFV